MKRLALLVALLVLAACGGNGEQEAGDAAATDDQVEQLDNVLALRSDFEADAGKTRVVLLFSPT